MVAGTETVIVVVALTDEIAEVAGTIVTIEIIAIAEVSIEIVDSIVIAAIAEAVVAVEEEAGKEDTREL